MIRCAGLEFFNPMQGFAVLRTKRSIRAVGSGARGLGQEFRAAAAVGAAAFDGGSA